MALHTLTDKQESFEVTVLKPKQTTSRVVLFSVGNGGLPERHIPLLNAFANNGCLVVAPHFERLAAPMPTEHELRLRARRLRSSLDAFAPQDMPVHGVGHSIGATMLVTLADGTAWLGPERPLSVEADNRLRSLVLFAPATGFFLAPGALDRIAIPLQVWVGDEDRITPARQVESFTRTVASSTEVELRIINGAGHFSFMHSPPPHMTDSLSDRDHFLEELTQDVVRFVLP